MRVNDPWKLLHKGFNAFLARRHVKLKSKYTLPQVVVVEPRVIAKHIEHIKACAGIVNEMVVVLPVNTGHDIPRFMMLRKVNQPVVTMAMLVTDEEGREVLCSAVLHQRLVESRLYEKSPVSVRLLDIVNRLARQERWHPELAQPVGQDVLVCEVQQ